MKKIVSLCLMMILLLSAFATAIPVSAAATEKYANYYEWNFEDSSLNDLENGVFYANTGNNALSVKTPTDLSVADTVNNYLTNNKATAGYSVKQAERVTNGANLGNALYICDRYLDFETDIHLNPATPWKIELVGSIPKGGMNNIGTNGIGKTALFANESEKDYFFVDGSNRAFWLYDNGDSFSVQSQNSIGAWNSNARIGQQRVQKLVITNELHDDNKWYIHYQIAECYNSTDEWTGKDTYFNLDCSARNWTFDGIGSNSYYLTSNPSGRNGYNPYFSSIKIWEDTSVEWTGVQLQKGVTAQDSVASVRMVANIRGLDWKDAGYAISLSNHTPAIGGDNITLYRTKTVYSSIRDGDRDLQNTEGNYYMALAITDIPQAKFASEIYVRPYVTDSAGNVIYGNVISFSVTDLLNQ